MEGCIDYGTGLLSTQWRLLSLILIVGTGTEVSHGDVVHALRGAQEYLGG